jgi:hypothetical protein
MTTPGQIQTTINTELDDRGNILTQEVPAGEDFSLRYEQLWGFVLRGLSEQQRRHSAAIEHRLAKLENRIS